MNEFDEKCETLKMAILDRAGMDPTPLCELIFERLKEQKGVIIKEYHSIGYDKDMLCINRINGQSRIPILCTKEELVIQPREGYESNMDSLIARVLKRDNIHSRWFDGVRRKLKPENIEHVECVNVKNYLAFMENVGTIQLRDFANPGIGIYGAFNRVEVRTTPRLFENLNKKVEKIMAKRDVIPRYNYLLDQEI